MEAIWAQVQTRYQIFIVRAAEPFAHVRIETLEALAIIVFSLTLLTTWLLRISWLFSKPVLRDQTIRSVPHSFSSSLKLNGHAYLTWRKVGGGIMGALAKQAIAEDSRRYYVATIVDRARKRPVLYKELLVRPGLAAGAIGATEIQLDLRDLDQVRLNNLYEEDDAPGSPIAGVYDVYLRRIQWWDIRHWLSHPNREIRIVIWVTVITTAIPYIIQALGVAGEATAKLLSTN